MSLRQLVFVAGYEKRRDSSFPMRNLTKKSPEDNFLMSLTGIDGIDRHNEKIRTIQECRTQTKSERKQERDAATRFHW